MVRVYFEDEAIGLDIRSGYEAGRKRLCFEFSSTVQGDQRRT